LQGNFGILLSNLGTPGAPTASCVRTYLREFLWDRRVVDLPRPLWAFVLFAFVLPFRPVRVARNYKKIWLEEGSPLLLYSQRQACLLQRTLREKLGTNVPVALGMRYGKPSIQHALEELQAAGCQHLLVFPLYPQYSSATTASTFDAVEAAVAKRTSVPEIRRVHSYHDHPKYIEALAQTVTKYWQENGKAERLLISFHGIPKRYEANGDPYRLQCEETAQQLVAGLALPEQQYRMTFQSRFGPEEWLQPYTKATLKEWGREGLASVDVICPGFASDCLETLEEIAIQNRRFFQLAGGQQFRYIPALNDAATHIEALAEIALAHLEHW